MTISDLMRTFRVLAALLGLAALGGCASTVVGTAAGVGTATVGAAVGVGAAAVGTAAKVTTKTGGATAGAARRAATGGD